MVDDLQWSDPSSLDVLSYLVARVRRWPAVGLLSTYRDTDLDEGHRLHGWLADALRMPSVSRVALGRMDAWTVEEMVLARGGLGPFEAWLARTFCAARAGIRIWPTFCIGEARSAGHGELPRGKDDWSTPCRRRGTVCQRLVVG